MRHFEQFSFEFSNDKTCRLGVDAPIKYSCKRPEEREMSEFFFDLRFEIRRHFPCH